MKLTAKARYAVMAVTDIAVNSDGRAVSLSDISVRQDISLSFLEQMFGQNYVNRGSLTAFVVQMADIFWLNLLTKFNWDLLCGLWMKKSKPSAATAWNRA